VNNPLYRHSFWVLAAAFSIFFVLYMQENSIALYREYWPGAITMIGGSFVAGSTPLGGGAVAFPVFSKLLNASTDDARTFGFLIQAVGMSFATLFFVLNRINIVWRWIHVALPAAIIGLMLGIFIFPLADALVKVVYSVFVVTSGVLLIRTHTRDESGEKRVAKEPSWCLLLVVGFVGGLLSSKVGAGADTILFFSLVILCRYPAKTIIPTSICFMALIAVAGAGFSYLATPHSINDFVINNWLAAAPVVAIGAPLGGLVMSKISPRKLIRFIKCVLLIEGYSTLLFVELPWLYLSALAMVLATATIYFIVSLLPDKSVKNAG